MWSLRSFPTHHRMACEISLLPCLTPVYLLTVSQVIGNKNWKLNSLFPSLIKIVRYLISTVV